MLATYGIYTVKNLKTESVYNEDLPVTVLVKKYNNVIMNKVFSIKIYFMKNEKFSQKHISKFDDNYTNQGII